MVARRWGDETTQRRTTVWAGWPAREICTGPEVEGIGSALKNVCEIMRGRDAGLSFAEIGERLGRDRSVIWREYHRNCLPDGDYHALMAHARATRKARRPKAFRLNDHRLCSTIEDLDG